MGTVFALLMTFGHLFWNISSLRVQWSRLQAIPIEVAPKSLQIENSVFNALNRQMAIFAWVQFSLS